MFATEGTMRLLATAAAASLALSLGWAADVQKKEVDIQASDGTNLKASYFSPGRSGPAMILLHQCNMDRHAWDGLANDLAAAGFHVLTFDFRGFGESGGGRPTDAAERRTVIQQKWPADVDAAYAYLIAQKGVNKAEVAAGGASCGVTQASDLATRHHEVRALMLLSGNASDAAKAYLASLPSLPVFGAASEGDTNAAKGIKEAVAASKNPHSTLKLYPGTEHGVPMFAKHAELEPMIVSWLKTQVAGHGAAHEHGSN
jgi:dienelactone hydrolase